MVKNECVKRRDQHQFAGNAAPHSTDNNFILGVESQRSTLLTLLPFPTVLVGGEPLPLLDLRQASLQGIL
jgi:hypothetical protein